MPKPGSNQPTPEPQLRAEMASVAFQRAEHQRVVRLRMLDELDETVSPWRATGVIRFTDTVLRQLGTVELEHLDDHHSVARPDHIGIMRGDEFLLGGFDTDRRPVQFTATYKGELPHVLTDEGGAVPAPVLEFTFSEGTILHQINGMVGTIERIVYDRRIADQAVAPPGRVMSNIAKVPGITKVPGIRGMVHPDDRVADADIPKEDLNVIEVSIRHEASHLGAVKIVNHEIGKQETEKGARQVVAGGNVVPGLQKIVLAAASLRRHDPDLPEPITMPIFTYAQAAAALGAKPTEAVGYSVGAMTDIHGRPIPTGKAPSVQHSGTGNGNGNGSTNGGRG